MGSVLDDCLFSLSQFFGQLGHVNLRVWFAQFFEDLFQEAALLALLFLLLYRWQCFYFFLFFGLLVCESLDHFLADFSNAVVIVGPVGAIWF